MPTSSRPPDMSITFAVSVLSVWSVSPLDFDAEQEARGEHGQQPVHDGPEEVVHTMARLVVRILDPPVQVQEREQGEAQHQDHEDEDAESVLREIVHCATGVGVLAPVPEDELEREDSEGEVEGAPSDETDEPSGPCPC